MNPIVGQIKSAPYTTCRSVAKHEAGNAEYLASIPGLWDEVGWLFDEIDEIRLFSDDYEKITRRNGWFIDSRFLAANMLETTIGERIGFPSDYLENYRMIGSWSTGDRLAIGASEECMGKIAIVYTQVVSEYGNVPLIARSLKEWFEQTLRDGPDCKYPYWQRQGFDELGSAIPDDPAYESPIIA